MIIDTDSEDIAILQAEILDGKEGELKRMSQNPIITPEYKNL
jgi:hypothetical protein